MIDPKFKEGDWAHWDERPAIVIQNAGDKVEISIWVDAKELSYVYKH